MSVVSIKGRHLRLIGIGLLMLLAALLLDVLARDGMARLGNQLGDAWQRLQPRTATADPGVVVVDIDEASLQRIGQWPWSRDRIGDMVDALGQAGAAAIAFDMVFTEADRTSLREQLPRLQARGVVIDQGLAPTLLDNDLAFADAIARNPVVLGIAPNSEDTGQVPPPMAGSAYAGSDPRSYLPAHTGGLANLPVLTAVASGMGSFAFTPDADNIIRQMPLVSRVGDDLHPGLSVEALRVAQGASGIQLKSTDASGQGGGTLGLSALKVGMLELPSTAGAGIVVHYSGMPHMSVIPAWRLLEEPHTLAAQVEGRIVLVGTSAIGLRDIVATPLAAAVPGVFVHAELLDQAFNGQYLQRPDWARGGEVLAAIIAGILLIAAMLPGHALPASLLAIVLSALALVGSWWAYSRHQWLLDPLVVLLVLLMLFAVLMPLLLFAGNKDRRFVREAFGRYLSPTLVQRLADDPQALQLGGETRHISVLFSDIRGFTTLSESLEPDALTALLNGFLTPMTEVLLAHEATIDKYIGDAIMAFWNAPLDIADHPRKACLGALDMLAAVQSLNATQGTDLRIGVGLHCGSACVGNLGSQQRFSYSAIGDTVNLAARVEGLTKQYGVSLLVTGDVRAQSGDLAFIEADCVRVVGRSAPVHLYVLLGDAAMAASTDFQTHAERHAKWLQSYRAGHFDQALATLKDLRQGPFEATLDGLYALHETRLQQLILDRPANWDGVFTATAK